MDFLIFGTIKIYSTFRKNVEIAWISNLITIVEE